MNVDFAAVASRFGLLVCVSLALTLGGCASEKFVQIIDEPSFQREVLDAKKPVLVDFYKGACPTCGMVQPTLDKLLEEYSGRVVFAQFKLMEPYFAVVSQKIKDQYDISYWPTIIIFVDGQPKSRYALEYDIEKYRKGLNEALAAQAAAATK